MNLPGPFGEPNPVALTVRSSLRRAEVLDRLQRAFGDYYETESRDLRYLGLDGSVAGEQMTLFVRPFIRPGERQVRGMLPIALQAETVTTADGSELRATATAPVGRAGPASLAAGLIAWILFGLSGGPLTGALALLGGGLIAAGWTGIIRYNQRGSLRKIDAVAGILESILNN